MATPSKQIGWGAEENLLSFISKQLGYLINVAYNSGGGSGTGPQGPQGVQGPAGPLGPVGPAGLEWQGQWVSGTSYVADDAVGYDGASWFCILATSGTTAPDLDTTHWALLASQGAQGPTGAQGPSGSLVPIVASAPLTGGTITTSGTIGIAQATASVDGYLSSGDFNTFSGKANVNSQVFTGTPSLPIGTIGVTQAVGTNNTTLATTEFVVAVANNRLVVETALSYSLTNVNSGGIIIFTASASLEIPLLLANGFECTFVTLDGVTLTVPAVAGITLNNATNPTGSNVLAPKSSFTLKRMIAANTFIATGNL
jgi:hypothetical protein